jgi:metal-responsive CopG/Arc/MetJ family transcriptional regulator
MTFTLPEDLATRFVRRVPARNRSRYVADALAQKLAEREKRLIRACEIVNADREVRQIEREFNALTDEIEEAWKNAPSR